MAVKQARPTGADRLAAEADLLARARHPGLIARVDFTRESDGSARLVTDHVSTRSLATPAARPVDQTAAVVAAVATIVADLHDLGLTHGKLEPSHILLDGEGRPVLCSPAGTGRPSDDVEAIGEILAGLLGCELDGEPIPDRRFIRSRSPSWRHGHLHRALLNLADQARADEETHRPTARALAASIHDLVPDAHLSPTRQLDEPASATPLTPGSDIDRSERPRRGTASRGRRILVGSVAAAALMLLLIGWRSLLTTAPPPRPDAGVGDIPAHPDGCHPPGPTQAPGVDIDGDGCPEPIAADEGVVRVGDRRWAIGEPTDDLAFGDWDCDGQATAALLRPRSGEVFVFDQWAEPGEELVARRAATVPGATAIEAVAEPTTRCHMVEVRDADGRSRAVEVEARDAIEEP